MAKHLDLEEQEQLDQLKAFWARWGAPIVWLLIVVFGALAAWNGWQYWQRRQAAQASVLFEEVERAVQASDLPRLERSLGDMQGRYPKTVLTQQASLLAAKTQFDKGNAAAAKTALAWAADQGSDAALRAVARLRLAALAMDAKAYDDALKHLQASWPAPFEALAADRRGDVYALQGKRDEATGVALAAAHA